MNTFCEFSVGFDSEIEDLNMYDEDVYSEEQITEFVNRLISENKILVGERCEGTLEYEVEGIRVKTNTCVDLGEDYDTDNWEEEEFVEGL